MQEKNPTTVQEWKDVIKHLDDHVLSNFLHAVNSFSFCQKLMHDGFTSLECKQIVFAFAQAGKKRDLFIPVEGLYDLSSIL